jgi:hypothetical protein
LSLVEDSAPNKISFLSNGRLNFDRAFVLSIGEKVLVSCPVGMTTIRRSLKIILFRAQSANHWLGVTIVSSLILDNAFFFLFQKNKDKFEKWRKFSLRYYLVYFVVVLIFPWHIGDAFLGFQKSDVVFLLTGLHFIISWFYLLGKNTK